MARNHKGLDYSTQNTGSSAKRSRVYVRERPSRIIQEVDRVDSDYTRPNRKRLDLDEQRQVLSAPENKTPRRSHPDLRGVKNDYRRQQDYMQVSNLSPRLYSSAPRLEPEIDSKFVKMRHRRKTIPDENTKKPWGLLDKPRRKRLYSDARGSRVNQMRGGSPRRMNDNEATEWSELDSAVKEMIRKPKDEKVRRRSIKSKKPSGRKSSRVKGRRKIRGDKPRTRKKKRAQMRLEPADEDALLPTTSPFKRRQSSPLYQKQRPVNTISSRGRADKHRKSRYQCAWSDDESVRNFPRNRRKGKRNKSKKKKNRERKKVDQEQENHFHENQHAYHSSGGSDQEYIFDDRVVDDQKKSYYKSTNGRRGQRRDRDIAIEDDEPSEGEIDLYTPNRNGFVNPNRPDMRGQKAKRYPAVNVSYDMNDSNSPLHQDIEEVEDDESGLYVEKHSRPQQHHSNKPRRRSSGRKNRDRGGDGGTDNRRNRRHHNYSDEEEVSQEDWDYETKRNDRPSSEEEEYESLPEDLNTIERKESPDWENERRFKSRRPQKYANEYEGNRNEINSEVSEEDRKAGYSEESDGQQQDTSSGRRRGHGKKKRRKNQRPSEKVARGTRDRVKKTDNRRTHDAENKDDYRNNRPEDRGSEDDIDLEIDVRAKRKGSQPKHKHKDSELIGATDKFVQNSNIHNKQPRNGKEEAWADEDSYIDEPTSPQKERKRTKKKKKPKKDRDTQDKKRSSKRGSGSDKKRRKKKKKKRSKEKARKKQMPEPPTPTADTHMPLDQVGLSTPSIASFEGTTIDHGLQEMSRMSLFTGYNEPSRVKPTGHHGRVPSRVDHLLSQEPLASIACLEDDDYRDESPKVELSIASRLGGAPLPKKKGHVHRRTAEMIHYTPNLSELPEDLDDGKEVSDTPDNSSDDDSSDYSQDDEDRMASPNRDKESSSEESTNEEDLSETEINRRNRDPYRQLGIKGNKRKLVAKGGWLRMYYEGADSDKVIVRITQDGELAWTQKNFVECLGETIDLRNVDSIVEGKGSKAFENSKPHEDRCFTVYHFDYDDDNNVDEHKIEPLNFAAPNAQQRDYWVDALRKFHEWCQEDEDDHKDSLNLSE